MWLWVMAVLGGLWKRGDRARALAGAMIDPSPAAPCDGVVGHVRRTAARVRGRIMRMLEVWVFRVSGPTGRGLILSGRDGAGRGRGRRGRGANLIPVRWMAQAEFGYFCQDEAARFGRSGAMGAGFAASCEGPGAPFCDALGPGPWARADHSAQSGLRFSRKAVMPSSVSRQSMFSTIVAPVRA